MANTCIAVITFGISICLIGAAKSIKSRFKDIYAIIWCFAGEMITVLGMLLTLFL